MDEIQPVVGDDASKMREIGSSRTLLYISQETEKRGNASDSTSGTAWPTLADEENPRSESEYSRSSNNDNPNIISWDRPDDPENPRNWSKWAKFSNLGAIGTLTFTTLLASEILAPGVPYLMSEFGSNNSVLSGFVLSVFLLGYAVGPLVIAPLSELYGRLYVYHWCNLGFLLFTIACAVSPNLPSLFLFRFFEGVFGSAPLVTSAGSIVDLIVQEKRGRVIGIIASVALLGPVIGPVAGVILIAVGDWRTVLFSLAIIAAVFTLLSFVCLRETNHTIILERKAACLRKYTGNSALRVELASDLTAKAQFRKSLSRPMKLMLFSPIVCISSIYTGIIYGYLYVLSTTLTFIFQRQYDLSTFEASFIHAGFTGGSFLGLGIMGTISDRVLSAKAKAASESSGGGEMKPEYRLPSLIPVAIIIPIGLFIYGWTAELKNHWVAPIIGTGIVGFGSMGAIMCITTYLVDAFPTYAASALAANTVLRSILGAVLPLAGEPMYNALGPGWGNSLLAFVALAVAPVGWWMMRYGEKLRGKFDFRSL